MNFSLTFFTPPAFRNIQWKVRWASPSSAATGRHFLTVAEQVYLIFGTFCVAALVHVFLLFQETQGKSLEEVDDIFNNESVWAFRVKHRPGQFTCEIENVKNAKYIETEDAKVQVEMVEK